MTRKLLSPFVAARDLITVLRAYNHDPYLTRVDLNQVREILPQTALGKGVRTITKPQGMEITGFEGALIRNPNDHALWGIMYNDSARAERQRFTIAHELGHLVLHRHLQDQFTCSKEDIHLGLDAARKMEREADEFAANLLMPGDQVRAILDRPDIDFHHLSEAATEFGVSLEAMCLRFVKYTKQRVILIHWDNEYLNYQWRSDTAVRTRTKLKSRPAPIGQSEFPDTLAANADIEQAWAGETIPATLWCSAEPFHIEVRECKHSSSIHERVLTLLIFEDAELPKWNTGREDGEAQDSFSHFSKFNQPVGPVASDQVR